MDRPNNLVSRKYDPIPSKMAEDRHTNFLRDNPNIIFSSYSVISFGIDTLIAKIPHLLSCTILYYIALQIVLAQRPEAKIDMMSTREYSNKANALTSLPNMLALNKTGKNVSTR